MKTGIKKVVIFSFLVSLVLALVSGCTPTPISKEPYVEITFIQSPMLTGEKNYPCIDTLVTNPSQGQIYPEVYFKFIDLDSQGRILDEDIYEDPFYLSPGYQKEFHWWCTFYGQPGWYTRIVQLITAGPDGTVGTSDDVILAEDRADFELR